MFYKSQHIVFFFCFYKMLINAVEAQDHMLKK